MRLVFSIDEIDIYTWYLHGKDFHLKDCPLNRVIDSCLFLTKDHDVSIHDIQMRLVNDD